MSDDAVDLVRRHIDGLLDAGSRRRLEELLEADPRARRVYVEELRLHAELQVKLRGVGRPAATRRRLVAPPRPARSSAPSWLAASAAAALVMVAIATSSRHDPPPRPVVATHPAPPATVPVESPKPQPLPLPPPRVDPVIPPARVPPPPVPPPPAPAPDPAAVPPPVPRPDPSPTVVAAPAAIARLEKAQGDVRLANGEAVQSGVGLAVGAGLACRAGASAEIVFPDGARVRLAAESALTLVDDQRVHLEAGSLSAAVPRLAPRRPLRFRTPHAEAVVLGTSLRLSVRADGTRLDVDEGRVRFTKSAGGATTEVAAGQYAVAGPSWTPVARPLPRSSIESALAERGAVTIKFGPEGVALPGGELNDSAQEFDAARGYGWSGPADERGTARRAKSTHVFAGTRTRAALWAARVPNGAYLLSLVLGDDRPQGPQHVTVQGRLVVDAQATAADQYLEVNDIPAVVKDGILSVTLGGHQKPSVGRGGDSTLCTIHLRFAR